MFFRGIYYPPKGAWGWMKVIAQNGRAIGGLIEESFTSWPGGARARERVVFNAPLAAPANVATGAAAEGD